MKVPASAGDGGSPVTLASGQGGIGGLGLDSTSVYWTTQTKCIVSADGGLACGGTVMSTGLDGGAPATLAGGQDTTGYVAVDGTSVYWPTSDGIARVALDGGSVTTLVASDPNYPFALVQQAATLYWADTVCPADGGPCTGALMKLAKP